MFKDALRSLRTKAELSQEELAKRLGLSKSTISMYENGSRQPNFEILEAIADTFNVDMNTLIGNAEMERCISSDFHLTKHEKEVIIAYRQQPSLQIAVDRTLGITPLEDKKEKRA